MLSDTLPPDVIYDTTLKMPFMKKLYSLYTYYHSLDYVLPQDIVTVMDGTFNDLIQYQLASSSPVLPKFDGYTFKELFDIISQWNSLSFTNALIYRGTSERYLDNNKSDYYESGGVVRMIYGKPEHLTYWSYLPASALIFSGGSYKPILIVAKYDPTYCSPDNYFLLQGELSGLVDDRLYNYGAIRHLREMEIRCYKFPVANTKYVLKGKALIDLYNMLIPVYREYMTEEEVKKMKDGFT